MTEHMTPLERWKELAIIENARMKRRLIGRDDMHAYAHKPWPLEKLRKEIRRCLSRHDELSVGDLCSMIDQDAVHIDIGLKTMRERRTIVKTSFIEGQQLYRLRTQEEFAFLGEKVCGKLFLLFRKLFCLWGLQYPGVNIRLTV